MKFNKFYPLLERAKGQLSIYGTRLVATATEGWLQPEQGGDVDLGGSSFIIPDTSLKNGNSIGILRAQARGSALAALSLLNRAPLQVLDKVGLPVGLGSGQVAVTATASMPLRDKLAISEIDYHYSGTVTGVESDVLVPGHALASDRLVLSGDNDHVEVSGAGVLAGLPITARWRQALGAGADGVAADGAAPGRVTGEIELSERTIDAFRIGLPDGAVSGAGLAKFDVTLPPGAPVRLEVSSDLAGVGLRVSELGWRKPAAATGTLSFNTELDDTPTIEDLTLEASGLALSGRVTLKPDGGLDQAQFSSVALGGWLQGPVTLTGRGDATPAIAMSGGRLDLRRAPFSSSDGAGGSSGGNTPITLALAQLVFFVFVQAPFTGGENGLQGVPRGHLFGLVDMKNNMAMYYFVLAVFVIGFAIIQRTIHSPYGQVLKAIRENEPRAVSLGYNVDRHKLLAFVISAALAGLAGATKTVVFQLASLTDVYWSMSGEVVLMTLLGGMGTVFGPLIGAAVIVTMQNYFAGFGAWVTVLQGVIFVVSVLLFREGIVGVLAKWLKKPL